MAAESVDDVSVMVKRDNHVVTVHGFTGPVDQIGRIWEYMGILLGGTHAPVLSGTFSTDSYVVV